MTLAADIADDLSLFDGAETVRVYHRDLKGVTVWESPAATALKMMHFAGPANAGSGAQLHATRARWQFQANTLERPVKKGDRFDSAAHGTWEFERAELRTLGTRYACDCWLVTPPTPPVLDEAGEGVLDEAGLAITEG